MFNELCRAKARTRQESINHNVWRERWAEAGSRPRSVLPLTSRAPYHQAKPALGECRHDEKAALNCWKRRGLQLVTSVFVDSSRKVSFALFPEIRRGPLLVVKTKQAAGYHGYTDDVNSMKYLYVHYVSKWTWKETKIERDHSILQPCKQVGNVCFPCLLWGSPYIYM